MEFNFDSTYVRLRMAFFVWRNVVPSSRRTWAERAVHALGFELIALALCAPVSAWLLQRPLLQTGSVSVLLTTLAMLWNMAYNAMFDHFLPPARVARGLRLRALHACGFELGLALLALPLAAALLHIPLWHALGLEVGFLLFMLPYTLAYNGGYDALRRAWVRRHAAR